MLLLSLLQGCGIYSFSGISLPPEAKTFSLSLQSGVSLGPPELATRLQQRLGDELLRCTSLKQVETQGDLRLEGSIKGFSYASIAPVQSVQGDKVAQASIERLTIEVELTYINPYDEDSSFSKKTFLQYADMAANMSRSSEEHRLIDDIFTKLVESIFNETVASW